MTVMAQDKTVVSEEKEGEGDREKEKKKKKKKEEERKRKRGRFCVQLSKFKLLYGDWIFIILIVQHNVSICLDYFIQNPHLDDNIIYKTGII